MTNRLLIIDDETSLLEFLELLFKEQGYSVTTANCVTAARERLASDSFDLVLCDAPCSGSGSWRRSPEGKWKLSEPGLAELNEIQSGILRAAAPLVAPGGILAYATCSVLHCENTDVVEDFLGSSGDWELVWQKAWSVTGGTDGFYSAHLTRKS